MKTAKEFIDEVFHTQKMMPYTEKCVTEIIHKFAAQQVVLERERIKKELLDIINLYNDNEMFGYSVAKNAIENL